MLNRFYKNKIAIVACADKLNTLDPIKIDWAILEHSLNALKIFDVATNMVSAEKNITVSHVGLLSKMIIRKLNETDYTIPELGNLVTHLKEGVKKRLEIYSNNQIIAKSMLLDPRIKKQGFHEEPLKYRETYELIIQELIPFQTPSMNAQEPHNIDNEANLLLGEFITWVNNAECEIESPIELAKNELNSFLKIRNIDIKNDP